MNTYIYTTLNFISLFSFYPRQMSEFWRTIWNCVFSGENKPYFTL